MNLNEHLMEMSTQSVFTQIMSYVDFKRATGLKFCRTKQSADGNKSRYVKGISEQGQKFVFPVSRKVPAGVHPSELSFGEIEPNKWVAFKSPDEEEWF